ncbi:hypothetical protein KAW18_01175 [candidate division WOR-3 bacterium]|nr:hypothetical protein [candidate division WOR-3 bacterium]
MSKTTKYKEDYLRIAEVVCEEGGLSLRQLGKALGVCAATIIKWKKKYPEFGDAVDRGCQAYDKSTAKDSLQKRLEGYFYNETTSTLVTNPVTGTTKMQISRIVKKHMPADVHALTLFLLNRDSENWKYRQVVDINVLQKLSDKEIDKRISLIVDNTKKRKKRATG